jgi:hypothetical protein
MRKTLRHRYGRASTGHAPPYTIEVENRLLGTRQHWKKSPHDTLESARDSAKAHADRSRSFATYNILDARGRMVESHQGTK